MGNTVICKQGIILYHRGKDTSLRSAKEDFQDNSAGDNTVHFNNR